MLRTALLSVMLGAAGCGKDENRVVLYASADEYVVRQVVQRFEEETGITVDVVGDSEVSKTTGLVNRLRSEADRPVADVFWSSECFMMIQLAEEGLLEPHTSSLTETWPEDYRDPGRLWYGFAQRARVLVYASDRITRDEVPTTWIRTGAPRWRGRVVMADPRFGTTRGHLGAMRAFWKRELPMGWETFLEYMRDNELRLLPGGNAAVVQAVANGEADIGFTDTDDVWAAQRNGFKVDLVYPYHGEYGRPGDGTLLIPNTVALVRGGAHSENAARLLDFLLSDSVEHMLAESDSHNLPTRPELAGEFSQYAVPDPLNIPYTDAAEQMDAAVQELMDVLESSE